MNRLIIVSSVILFAIIASANAFSLGSEITGALNLENVTTIPDKVYPGADINITGTVRNIADRDLYFVRITVQGGFPFSKTSPLTSFYVARLMQDQGFQFSVPMTIDKDATDQQYPLQVAGQYSVYDSSVSKVDNVVGSQVMAGSIKVDRGVEFAIVNATFPQSIVPDLKDGEMILYIQNTGANPAEEVQINLAAEYPFVPTGKSFFIQSIKPGETSTAVFHLDVDSAAATQTYPLDATIKWKEDSNTYSETKTFGIPVEKAVAIPALSVLQQYDSMLIVGIVAAIIVIVILARMMRRAKKKAK